MEVNVDVVFGMFLLLCVVFVVAVYFGQELGYGL